jgi:rhodanese-related sulfurtransferase
MKTNIFLSLLFALAFGGAINAQNTQKFEDMLRQLYKNTVSLSYAKDLQGLKNVIFLDAREEEEYNISHIPNAVWIGYKNPNWFFIDLLSRDAYIVVYCSVGYRSERIGEDMLKRGFKNVSNLYGGLFDWFNQGFPTVNQYKIPTNRIHTYDKKWSKWVTRGEKIY